MHKRSSLQECKKYFCSAACADPFEDKDHNCNDTKVKFRVRTRNIILDDGFLWLKNGENGINRHTDPRSYLKCVASRRSGCKALKRVQRCSNIEDFVEFMYLGRHNSVYAIIDKHRGRLFHSFIYASADIYSL
ncbi:hypothetical protein GOP47_0021483 [Adiantum capillus-veneris]|uniref:WRKY domain-containing protein n=1 Tax=Adiantum capillus-veneris TaxID=13818 RepID=A0A9D4Z7W7_ADICA|nr:hypothetical protein GOP47_0021483 [Adiantum capillus-veneris]